MIKMSFYDGTLKRDELKNFINQTEKEILYTYGFSCKNPITCREKITKEKALEIVSNEDLLDADEGENFIHLNAYSSNDMY